MDDIKEIEEVMFRSPLANWLQRFTARTPQQTVFPYVNEVQDIKDIKKESSMSEGSLDRKINMTTNQDTTTDELLK